MLASNRASADTEAVDLETTKEALPLTKRLTPMRDGSLKEDDQVWPAGTKTIEQRTLDLLNDGYVLMDTRIDATRLFRRREMRADLT